MDNPTNTPKTIIYLDQFVISNITKILDPDFPRREHLLKSEPFWLDLYKKLDRLLRLQLIVCPHSYYHLTESLVSKEPPFDSLQDVYSYLANDCTFQDEAMILRWQLLHHFRDYLDGHPEHEPAFPVDEIVSGDINEWQDTIRVTVPYRSDSTEAQSIRAQREERHKRLEKAFELWQQEREPYAETVQEEARSLGQSIISVFMSHVVKWMEYTLGLKKINSPLDLLPPPSSFIVFDLIRILEGHGVSEPMEHLKKIREYFESPHILQVPFIRLSSMLYAAIARKAPDMKSSPNKGTITDVTAIASILPYCNAIFVDNGMAAYLRERPLRDEATHFGTRVFSPNKRADFLTYLDELEAGAGERHLKLVKWTYKEKWLDPFMDVVAQGKRSRERNK